LPPRLSSAGPTNSRLRRGERQGVARAAWGHDNDAYPKPTERLDEGTQAEHEQQDLQIAVRGKTSNVLRDDLHAPCDSLQVVEEQSGKEDSEDGKSSGSPCANGEEELQRRQVKGGHHTCHGTDQDKRHQASLTAVSLEERHEYERYGQWDDCEYRDHV